jgi:protein-disulfide isomerase
MKLATHVVLIGTLAAGCGARPAKVTALEGRVAALEAEVAALRGQGAARDRAMDAQLSAATAQMVANAQALEASIDKLKATAAAVPPPLPPRRPGPDAALTYAVPLDNSPALGPAHAKVTIVMGTEFACPFCRRAWDTIDALRTKYGVNLRVVYKTFIVHPQQATTAAQAACAAHHQNKWRAMADALWTRAFDKRDFSEANMLTIGHDIGLDTARQAADMHGATCAAELQRDQQELTRLGQSGTPTFWINGRWMVGAQPQAAFETLIDEELAKAEAAIKGGVKVDKYYDTLVKSGVPEAK